MNILKNRLILITLFIFVYSINICAMNEAVVVEVETQTLGSNFAVNTQGEITYIYPSTDLVSSLNPGTDSKIVTCSVVFNEAGNYDLYVKLRVGSGGYSDDSFFMPNGFGIKSSTLDSDWQVVNGLVPFGYVNTSDVVDGAGSASTTVWKWLNISEYQNQATPVMFNVTSAGTYTFQLGAREDGLDIDKIAFGKSDLYYTVDNLENGESGSADKPDENGFLPSAYQKVESYLNPVLPGDHPDLTLFKDGDNFYSCGSNFHLAPYLAIEHSKDLVHWEVITRVIPADWSGIISDAPQGGTWEGAITYFYGSYWVYFSNTAGGGQYFCKAASPYGPWTLPVKMNVTGDTGASGYDNSVFVDDDGTPYMLIKNGKYVNRIQEIGTDGHLTGSVIDLAWINDDGKYSWAEGPVMCKRDGWYYYFIAGNIGGGQWVLRTQSLTADSTQWEELGSFFEPITDPAAPFRGPNHIAQPFQIDDGTWWTLSHSYEAVGGDNWEGKGRQGLLHQVIWDSNGKPTGKAPTTSPLLKPDLSKGGVAWRLPRSDSFNSADLDVNWHFMNTTTAEKYSLSAKSGWLTLYGSADSAHILQKDAGHYYSLVTKVEVNAVVEGQQGGLYICNGNQSVNVKLVSAYSGGQKKFIFSFMNTNYEVNNTIGNIAWLRLDRKEHNLVAYYSVDGVIWNQLGNVIDATELDGSQPNYNWWVGNSQGLYAEGISVAFDCFYYRDGMVDLPVAGNENHFAVTKKSSNGESYVVNDSEKGGWLMIGGVELGNDQRTVNQLIMKASSSAAGDVDVWMDDIENEGTKLGTVPISNTGGEGFWETFSININKENGQHDIFIRFNGAANTLFVKSIKFNDDGTSGINNHTAQDKEMLPSIINPFRNQLAIGCNGKTYDYTIVDLKGRTVENGVVNENNSSVAKRLLPAIYVLKLKNEKVVVSFKIVKVN